MKGGFCFWDEEGKLTPRECYQEIYLRGGVVM